MNGRRKGSLLYLAGAFVACQFLLALGAKWIAPYDPLTQHILARLRGSSKAHWLGTDQFGRDVLSRILYGYRASLSICLGAVGLALLIGGTIGLISAYNRGLMDRVLMRVMDVLFAFPALLLAIGILAMVGSKGQSATIAIAVVYTPIFARQLRGPAIVICESGYVSCARALGASVQRIVLRHVLPNLASIILVQTSLLLSSAILVEASFSFLGLGTQRPAPSLGQMLADGQAIAVMSPWLSIFSGLTILLLSFGFNLLGDALRETFDPRSRN